LTKALFSLTKENISYFISFNSLIVSNNNPNATMIRIVHKKDLLSKIEWFFSLVLSIVLPAMDKGLLHCISGSFCGILSVKYFKS
jgi:hypothetical protein